MLPAAECAAEILATRVAGMRQKADPAVKAENRAVPQFRMIAQGGIQRALIFPNKRKRAVVLVPLFAKRENVGDRYDKSARLSVKILICCCMSPSYRLDAKTSRGRARIFFCLQPTASKPTAQPIQSLSTTDDSSLCQPTQARQIQSSNTATWK